MKAKSLLLLAMTAFSMACFANSQEQAKKTDAADQNMQISNIEAISPSPGPTAYFTGGAKVKPLLPDHAPSRLSAGSVTFEPGARSAWHTHPLGQFIIVTEGSGLIQQWGKPSQQIHKGDIIWTSPGVKHWHGASANTGLTHTAIQETVNGKNVEWLEKVTDEQYKAAQK